MPETVNTQTVNTGTAEGSTTEAVNTQNQAQTSASIDYSKIEEILDKRTSSTAESTLKGLLKQQGLTGEELTQAITTYKTQKQQAELAKQQEANQIKIENAQLKAQILNTKIDNELTTLAIKEGVSAEKLPFVSKLINRDNLVDDKGEISEEKLKAAMDEVFKAFPEFKGTGQANSTGFTKIGGDSTGSNTSEVDAKLDAIFGIKK